VCAAAAAFSASPPAQGNEFSYQQFHFSPFILFFFFLLYSVYKKKERERERSQRRKEARSPLEREQQTRVEENLIQLFSVQAWRGVIYGRVHE
jgi:hypothetical protein